MKNIQERDAVIINEMLRTAMEYNRYRRHIQAIDKLGEAKQYYTRKINVLIDEVESFSAEETQNFFNKLWQVGEKALVESKKIKNVFSPDWRKECRRVNEAVQTIFEIKNQNKQQEKEM